MKKKAIAPSAPQQQASQLVTQDTAARDKQIANVNQQQQQSQETLNAAKPTLSRITAVDPGTGTTALRKALTTSLTSSTTNAYNNALVAARARGLQAGLQNQPMHVGNQAAIENERAKALSQIPGQVEQQATQEELQAVGLQNSQAGLENAIAGTGVSAASQYNPNGALSTEAQLEAQRQQQEELANQRRGGLWKGLAKVGLAAAAPFTGGSTALALGGIGKAL